MTAVVETLGSYPQRADRADTAWAVQALAGLRHRLQSRLPLRRHVALPGAARVAFEAAAARWQRLDEAAHAQACADLARRLRGTPRSAAAQGEALALAAATMRRTLGLEPYATQVAAAGLLLRGRLVEMATGEGKTLAAALAAAVAALGGVRVHVLTANDYLVQRDRETMAPFFAAFGLRCAAVMAGQAQAKRRAAHRADIVYTTGREIAFDYLRDHRALRGERDPTVLRARALAGAIAGGIPAPQPLVPGLQFAIVDEADSLLLDEACIPLLLAERAAPPDEAALRAAEAIAGALQDGRDYVLHAAARRAELTRAGIERVADQLQRPAGAGGADGAQPVPGPSGALGPLRRALELVEAALAAQLLFRRDCDYAVTARGLVPIDEVTGRLAEGRQWTGALHAMIELKEGLPPSPPTLTAGQITYQRFFPRWLHLCGLSGTLAEARAELALLYGRRVARVQLACPDRRRWLGTTLFVDAPAKRRAIAAVVRDHVLAGRPVLVGTDSVESSRALSAVLAAEAIEHQTLHAAQDADEAEAIARAGLAGMVTVATNIAGRGTDIRLGGAAAAAGGLHVLLATANRSRRIDRQLVGRCARHGDPGSAEAVLALDEPLLVRAWPRALRRAVALTAGRDGCVPGPIAGALLAGARWRAEWQDRQRRRDLQIADRSQTDALGFAGLAE
jgi:preprotein translocase subunit SecA